MSLKIKVSVPSKLAVVAGTPELAGARLVDLTASIVALLDLEERAWLAGALYDNGMVCVPGSASVWNDFEVATCEVSDDAIARSIRGLYQRVMDHRRESERYQREREESERRDHETHVQSLLDLDAELWSDSDGRWRGNAPNVNGLIGRVGDDPRLVDRVAQARRIADERIVANRAAEEAKAEAAAARKQLCELELRAYAAEIPELARAAREGYDIATAAVEHIARQVAASDGAIILREESRRYEETSWEVRSAPRAVAFETRDRVVAHVADVRRPSSVRITVCRIMRVELAREDGYGDETEPEKFTGIVVTISSACTPDFVVIIRAE